MDTSLLLTGAVMGSATAILYSLKQYPKILINKIKSRLLFSVVIYDYDELFFVFEEWLHNNHSKKVKSMEASFAFKKTEDIEKRSAKKVVYKAKPDVFSIVYKGKRFIISKNEKELNAATDFKNLLNFQYYISAYKGREKITEFLKEITDEYNKKMQGDTIGILMPNWSNNWYLTSKRFVKSLKDIMMPRQLKDKVAKDLDQFISSRQWYKDINVMWKRNYCLYGPPGTGKSTLAQSIAKHLNRDVCMLNLSSIVSDSNLLSLIANVPDNSVLLIEDIDCSTLKRDEEGEKKHIDKISLSCLLNCLDGLMSREGLITIITTNYFEKLDSALVRAGRIDMKIEMPLSSNPEIERYMSTFFKKDINIDTPLKLNMSAVQEMCIRYRNDSDKAIQSVISLAA